MKRQVHFGHFANKRNGIPLLSPTAQRNRANMVKRQAVLVWVVSSVRALFMTEKHWALYLDKLANWQYYGLQVCESASLCSENIRAKPWTRIRNSENAEDTGTHLMIPCDPYLNLAVNGKVSKYCVHMKCSFTFLCPH